LSSAEAEELAGMVLHTASGRHVNWNQIRIQLNIFKRETIFHSFFFLTNRVLFQFA